MSNKDEFDPIREMAKFAAMRTGAIPPLNTSLFRYVSLWSDRSWGLLECTILRDKIPLTTPVTFNDPFDSNPVVVSDVSLSEIDRVIKELPGLGLPLVDIQLSLNDGRLATKAEVEEHAIRSIAETLIRQQSPKIASFCRRISSQLLWAHYADSYKGLAYHFVVSAHPTARSEAFIPLNIIDSDQSSSRAKCLIGSINRNHEI